MEPEGSLPCSQEPSAGPYPDLDQFSPYYLSKINNNIIHSPRLHRPSDLFPSGFPSNILYAFIFAPIRATYRAHLILLGIRILIILGKEHKLMKLLIMQFSPISCNFIFHRSKYEGELISLWLYKENNKLRDWEKMYLLYIFPPELHTLLTSLF
jgi:hypothetical protein